MPVTSRNNIRRPLLAKGTKAAGLGIVLFLTISGHAFEPLGYAFVFRGTKIPRRSPPPDPELRIHYITKNRFIFESVFKA